MIFVWKLKNSIKNEIPNRIFLISTGMYSGKGVVWHYVGRYAESFFPSYDHYIQPCCLMFIRTNYT